MTKLDIVTYILSNPEHSDLSDRLLALYQEDRITSGAYTVYNPFSIYSYRQISALSSKAAASKDYVRYLKRIDSTQYQVWKDMYDQDLRKIRTFITEQEALPFEESQKQQLIANGELSA